MKITSLDQAVNRLIKNYGWPLSRALSFVSEIAVLAQQSPKYLSCPKCECVLHTDGKELQCRACRTPIDRGTRRKLTDEEIQAVRDRVASREKLSDLAREYNVDVSTISYHVKDLVGDDVRSIGQEGNQNARKLSDAQEQAIYRKNAEEGVSQSKLASEYRLSKATINRVVQKIRKEQNGE